MYNKVLELLDSKKNQNIFLGLYIITSSVLFVLWTSKSSIIVGNNDGYMDLFEDFIKNGWYAENLKGTSFIYNVSLSIIYKITNSVNTSFFILNLLSQAIILFLGVKMLNHFKQEKYRIISRAIIFFYVFRCLMLESYNKASNDPFLGVFIMLGLYLFIVKIYESKTLQKKHLVLLGIIIAISISIRPTGFFLAFIIFLGFVFWKIKYKIQFLTFFKHVFLLFLTTLIVSSLLNYPSLKEKGSLSFYSKGDPSKGVNWSQRNFLALQKIKSNNLPLNHANIWSTKFSEVNEYLKEHGKNALPENLISSIKKDPVLYIKLIGTNIIRVLSWIVRYTGFLFFLPMLLFFIYFKRNYLNISFLFFLTIVGILLLLVYSLTELRWFVGYEILIYSSILFSLQHLKGKNLHWLNGVYFCSIALVTLFNLKSILSLL